MSNLEYPEFSTVRVLDSADKLNLGGFQPTPNSELKHCVVHLYKNGTLPAGVKVKLGLHLSTDFTVQFAFSNEFFLSTVEALVDNSGVASRDFWRAWIRFDFSRINLNKNQLYVLSLQTDSYTRVGDTFFIGAIADDVLNPIYVNGTSGNHSWQLPVGKSVFAFFAPI